jgi:general secretion pathway protein D
MLDLQGKTACEEPVIRSLFRLAVIVLLVVTVTLPGAAESAKSLYNKGKEAEARENYEQAYDFYKQAYGEKPQDTSYRASYERLRFLAGASHVHRGQLLREAGRLDESLAEFQKAVEIDPSSAIARQEVLRTQQMIDAAKAMGPTASASPRPGDRRLQEAAGPVELTAIPNIPISLKITGDTKVIYETIGRLAGVNVLFDPDYTSRQIKVDLNSVSLEEALEITAMESKTFWRPVTQNTIFIAADNPAKRKEVEQSVVKTFYLANLSQPTELQDVQNALRQILQISLIQPLPSEGAIVVRGTPDQIALAEKLIGDLDKPKPEVIVDIAIMQISRDKSHTLGINPPTSATVQLQPNINTNTTTTTTNGTTTTNPNSSSGGGITLNALGNLNATDFQVTISSATATALFSDSNTKLIQNPQIRSVDGQKASLKIGQRIPTASGSFQPGIGGVGINPLVNTQFQYIDVGVNIDVTPRVHSNGEITLKVTMEVSAVDSFSNIGGISQPIIGQRKIDNEVRLREGEANLMGGMLEDSRTRSLSGIPGLAQIPILKYFFGQTQTELRQTETVFVLIPHIIRGQYLTDLNQRGIDVGTANSIELRRMRHTGPETSTMATSGPSASAATPSQSVPQSALQSPVQPSVSASSGASFAFDPPSISQKMGSTFAVNVMVSGVQNAYSVPLQVNYDPKLLEVVNVSNGTFLSQDGQIVTLVKRDDNTTGTLQINATRPPGSPGVSGQGTVVTVTFRAKTAGQATLVISRGGARDPGMQALPVSGTVAQVMVQ